MKEIFDKYLYFHRRQGPLNEGHGASYDHALRVLVR